MDRLTEPAEKYRCAILLLRHLSKQTGGKPIHRGLGSVDLTGFVRSEMLAGSLPDDPSSRAFIHIKSNVGLPGRSLSYAIDPAGRFAWTGETATTAEELLAAPDGSRNQKMAEAKQWLTDQLRSESCEQKEIRELAERAGISYATLRRAKNELGVQSEKVGMNGSGRWSLPEDAHEDVQTKNMSTFAEHEHLRTCSNSTKKLNISSLDLEGAQQESVSTLVNTFEKNGHHVPGDPKGTAEETCEDRAGDDEARNGANGARQRSRAKPFADLFRASPTAVPGTG